MISLLHRSASRIDVLARAMVPFFNRRRPTHTHRIDPENISVNFEFGSADEQVPLHAQEDFKTKFYQELASLRTWWRKEGWAPALIGNLSVLVSPDYKISRALVPAWEGHVGRMEFPARRVTEGKAAILHELVHVFFPNGNRLLAEGLAVYLQDLIGGNPAFPNFGRPLHALAREVSGAIVIKFPPTDPMTFEQPLCLTDLDGIASPNPLILRIGDALYGEEPRGQRRLYSIAGSFVKFLLANYGLSKFGDLYARTPLVQAQLHAGTSGRWYDVYRCPLETLETEWKSLVCLST